MAWVGYSILRDMIFVNCSFHVNWFFYLGGPVTFYEKNDKRHVLIGTVHGAFANCDNSMPGIYVRVDDSSNLQFLHKEALNSGKSIYALKETCRNSQTMI